MQLRDYLAQDGVSRKAFADLIGVSSEAVRRYEAGLRTPRPDQLRAIVEATEGKVTLEDLIGQAAA